MKNDPLIFKLKVAKNKPQSFRQLHHGQSNACPFCDVAHLTDIYRQEGEMIWLHNKYPTLEDTKQTVLIEGHAHLKDISSYNKRHNRQLMRFALQCYQTMQASGKYRSVVWYKNFGPHAGGSLIHPHMQIVGFQRENGYKYLHPNNFEGITVFQKSGLEVNVAQHPVQGYIELNFNLLAKQQISTWADWIQSGTKYLLHVMYHGRCDSYNLFFYPRFDHGICAKLIMRFDAPPYFVGYKLSQVNDYKTLVREAQRFRQFFEADSPVKI